MSLPLAPIVPSLDICGTRAILVSVLRDLLSRSASDAIASRGYFALALSGGSMIQLFSEALLGSDSLGSPLDVADWRVSFADERFVAPMDDASTFGGYDRAGLATVSPGLTLAVNHELELEECAADYEARLRDAVEAKEAGGVPMLDLVLLGMGPDGHTASLFPGHSLLQETEKLVAAIRDSPKPPSERVTMTLPLILAAQEVAFIATGESKAPVLVQAMKSYASEAAEDMEYPVEYIRPTSGNLRFVLDEPAAQGLKTTTEEENKVEATS